MKIILTFLAAALVLIGCQTVAGLQKDMGTLFAETESEGVQAPASPLPETPCPDATVMTELDTIVEFRDPAKPAKGQETATARITGIRRACARDENGTLAVRIDIGFEGILGAKGRARNTDKADFTFPYFIAVSDAKGTVVAKEIFAAASTFPANEKNVKTTETVTQQIPSAASGAFAPYKILIGFQLSPEQLDWNRAARP